MAHCRWCLQHHSTSHSLSQVLQLHTLKKEAQLACACHRCLSSTQHEAVTPGRLAGDMSMFSCMTFGHLIRSFLAQIPARNICNVTKMVHLSISRWCITSLCVYKGHFYEQYRVIIGIQENQARPFAMETSPSNTNGYLVELLLYNIFQ